MNVLLTYPRSGSHLTRFFLELLTGQPTCGTKKHTRDIPIYKNKFPEKIPFNIKNKNNYCYHKYHCHVPPLKKVKKIIFLIRNPREVLLRQNNYKMNISRSVCSFNKYFHLIDKFNKFKGKKKIFFYEDMISNKKNFINELYNFLDIDKPKRLKYILENIEKLYDLSSKGKNRYWGGVKSNGELNYYYNNKKNTIKKEFNKYLLKKLIDKKYRILVWKYFIPHSSSSSDRSELLPNSQHDLLESQKSFHSEEKVSLVNYDL